MHKQNLTRLILRMVPYFSLTFNPLRGFSMNKYLQRLPLSTIIFTASEMAVYITYLSIDLTFAFSPVISDIFKYAGVLLCFLYIHWIPGAHPAIRKSFLLLIFSDYFLLFTDSYFSGVVLFGAIQCLYFIYHSGLKRLPPGLAAVSLIFPGLWLISSLLGFRGILPAAASIYLSLLLTNLIFAFRRALASKNTGLFIFSAGLVFYLLCDFNVGLMNAPDYFSAATPLWLSFLRVRQVHQGTAFAIWFFYLPAQVLIALSQTSLSPSLAASKTWDSPRGVSS